MGGVLAVQETVEFIFFLVLVAVVVTTFLISAGFFLLDDPLLVHLLNDKSLSVDSSLSHISANSLIACSYTLKFSRCICFLHVGGF